MEIPTGGGNEKVFLPSGYRFNPTDQELIHGYLKNMILGLDLPADVIPTVDVFSADPDRLPLSEFKNYAVGNQWYFFSTRKKGKILTENGFYNISKRRAIYEENKLIGFVRTLDFYHGKPNKATKSQWTIEEFSINDKLVQVNKDDPNLQAKISDFVVCRIVKQCNTTSSSSEKEIIQTGEETDDEDIDSS